MHSAVRIRAGGLVFGLVVVRAAYTREVRNNMSDLKRSGTCEEAATLMNVEDLGWRPGPLFERSLPGLYDEVR